MNSFAFSIHKSFADSLKEVGAATAIPRSLGARSAFRTRQDIASAATRSSRRQARYKAAIPSSPTKRVRLTTFENSSNNGNLLWRASAFDAILKHERDKVSAFFYQAYTEINRSDYGSYFAGTVLDSSESRSRFGSLVKELRVALAAKRPLCDEV